MGPKVFAETERLILREMVQEDLEGFFAMDSDPQVHRYLGNKPVKDRGEIRAVIEHVRNQYKQYGIGRWTMILKETNAFVGWTGLKFVTEATNGHINYYDLGYRLSRNYWGQGYASEAAKASLHYGLEELKLNEIFAAAHIDNTGSNKILQKLGFRFIETFLYEGEVDNWYQLTMKME